jgi:hydrogenase nickel incorporation protein HypA/HybF
MHEFSLAQVLVEQVESIRGAENAVRVESVTLGVGEFAGVEPDLLRGAFEILIEETPVVGADLHIHRIPLESQCDACGIDFRVKDFRFVCPTCESHLVKIIRGEDLILESVALVAPDD